MKKFLYVTTTPWHLLRNGISKYGSLIWGRMNNICQNKIWKYFLVKIVAGTKRMWDPVVFKLLPIQVFITNLMPRHGDQERKEPDLKHLLFDNILYRDANVNLSFTSNKCKYFLSMKPDAYGLHIKVNAPIHTSYANFRRFDSIRFYQQLKWSCSNWSFLADGNFKTHKRLLPSQLVENEM